MIIVLYIVLSIVALAIVFAVLFGKSPDEEIIWKKLDDHEKMLGE